MLLDQLGKLAGGSGDGTGAACHETTSPHETLMPPCEVETDDTGNLGHMQPDRATNQAQSQYKNQAGPAECAKRSAAPGFSQGAGRAR